MRVSCKLPPRLSTYPSSSYLFHSLKSPANNSFYSGGWGHLSVSFYWQFLFWPIESGKSLTSLPRQGWLTGELPHVEAAESSGSPSLENIL